MKKLNAALALALILQTLAGALPVQAAEAPPLPSSFYGTVTLDGADVPAGTPVTAWVRGVQVAQAPSRTTDGDSVYVIDVPADDPATPQIEGGREGQAVLFKVDGYAAGQLGTWRSGVVAELNLAAVGHDGPDLAVVKDNGETEVYAGQPLTYTLTVVNVGRQGATGVSVVDTLPDHVTFVAAGEGGSEAGGVVTWPAFDLDVDGIAERTVVVEVGDPLAAGVNVITNTVSVADDGAGGADPTPVNNTAVDADAVAAAPALAVSTRELLLCAPDDPVLPSLSSFLISSVQEVEYSCGAGELSTGARDRLASAARALGRAFEDDPLVTGSDDLLALGDAIGAHITCDAALFSDLSELQVAVADLQDQVCGVAHHGVSAAFQPGSTFTLVGRPVTVTLFLQNRGTDLMAYTVNLQSPISTSSTPFTVTLDAGQTFTAPVVATPMEVGNFTLVADVQAVGQDGILSYAPHTQATAALRGLDAYLEVVEVSAQPVFIEHASGTTATLHARIANLTQAPISGRARTRVWDSAGSPVFTATRLLRFESALLDVQYDLGTLDTAGLERGFYTVTLEVIGADDTLFPEGDTIPRGAGWGLLGVGQAVEARSWVDADVVVPGNPTVGTYIETELVAYEEPLSMTVDLDRAVFTAEAGSGVVGSTPAKCALCAGGPTLAAPSVPLVVDSLPATVEEPVGIAPGVVLDMDAAPVQQSAWPYTKTVAVYNPGTSALTDYQVRLDVPYLTGMNADFSDVRFKADPAGDFLPYWTESYSESVSAVTWVKVDSLPAQSITELIVYYGDPTAVDESDGGSVFEFFDDFEGSAIDGGKWSVIGSADRLVVSDGYLDLTVADNSGVSGEIVNGIRAHSSYTVGHSILGRVRDPDGSPDNHISYVGMTTLPACHTFWNCSQKGLTIYQNTDYDFLSNSRDTSQEYTENNYGSISDWHTYRIDYAGGSLARFYRDDELRSMHTADDVIPDIDSLYPAIGGNDYSNRDPHMYYDWILVRQYADPEPIVVVSSDDIVIDEDTTWDAGIYHVRNLTVTNSANLILSSRIDADNDYADDYGITIYAENVVVEEGASIIADGQGYAGGMGPGVGGASSAGGGGGYGGRGGVSNSGGVGGAVYGSIYRPTHLGSSGGIPSDGAPGAGGGAVHLVVSDTLTVDGIISANGAASYRRGGGGSGGSIWVEVETLVTTGSGERLIRANGGRGNEHYGRGGGGSGGRVAVYAADVDAFQAAGGQIEARGGSSNHQWGGAGTVYLYEEGQNVLGDLVVKNGANEGTETELEPGSWEFDTIEMAEYGHLRVVSRTSVLTVANGMVSGDGTARLIGEGIVVAPQELAVDGVVLVVEGDLAGTEVLTTTGSGGVELHAHTPWRNGVYTFTEVTVGAGTTLRLIPHDDGDTDYEDDYGMELRVENLTVAAGGVLESDGQGYAGGMGPGVGGASSAGGGGGYGGRGGVSNSGGVGGAVYGSIYRPTHLGSSGGIPSDGAPGAGGGAVHLVVSDTLTVDGIISANGAASYRRGGGGSGGSIWVEVETLVTTGSGERLIRANGGRGNEHYGRGGGGSGGRVAVYAADVDAFQAAGGQIEARGGSSNHQWGGAGTVYLYEEGQNVLGDLVVKNGANEGTETELEPGSWEFDTIEMAEYGHLRVVSRTSVLTLANNTLVTDSTSRLTSEGAVIVPASFDVVSMTLNVQGELLGAEDIAITLDSHLILHAGPYPLGTLALGDVTVNGTLTLASYDNDDAIYDDGSDYGFTLHADNLTIGASGVVEADGLGHLLNNGLGTHADGAGHAGYGGGEAPIYGSPYTPVTLGSSGDGGRGGGAIHLVISDTLQVEGALQANGVSDGSGGSLWVQTALLTGTGHIAADGGDQAGGGGYIAIYAGDSVGYTGTFGVAFGHGGVACPVAGKCDGVVYRDDVDPYASTIDVSPDELVADGIGTGIITVTLKTIDGTPMPYKGVEVRISPENAGVFIAGQSAIDYVPIGTTDTSGMVTTVITSTVPGARTVEARTVEGEVVEQTATVTFTVGDVDEDASLVETDETTLWASGEDEATVTATLVDGYDHPVSGKVVLIQSTGVVTLTQALTTTDAQGQVQATVRSTEVQTVTVTAFDQTDDITLTQQVTLSFIAGPVDPVHSTVTVTPTILVAGVQTATVEAVLLDELDRPVVGREVELVVGGSGNTITPDPGIADGSGRVTFLLASTGAGIKDVSVQSDGVVVDGGQVLFVNDVPDADESKVTVSPSRVAADGVQTATVSVVVNDEYGNPVAGVPVTLSHDGATLPVTLTQPSALTDEDGLATGSIACARAGQVTVSAAVMEMPIFDTATVTFEGADLDVLGTSGPQKVIAGGVMTVTISVANVGRVVAEDVILTATLAADVSDIVVGGTHPFTQTGHVVVWQLDEMAAGEGIDVPVRVTAPGASATLETWVEARSSTEEEQLSNNVDSISTTVVGAELDVQKSASPVNVVVDYPVTYTIHLENQGWTTATSVVLTDTLPQHLHFVTHTAPYPFTQDGRLLTWQVGDLPAGADVDFEVVATVGDTAPLDAVLVNRVEATSEAALDDEDAASVTIKAGYRFDAWLQPAEATTSVGAPTTYRIRVRNTGTMPDDYAVALDGLDSPWYTLEPATLHLPAGATGEALVTVLVSGCAYTGTHPFEVEVTGVTRGVKETLDGTLNLHAEPFISGLSPANSAKLGSTSALFAWTTNVTATTSLLIRPDDGISPYTEVTGASGTSHSVLVEGLDRNTTYLWKVRSQSACGVEESGERALTIGNGLVFAPCTYDFTVDRDYDQRVTMQVRNDDLVSHTLLLTIEVSTEDLIVGFIGSGSVDEEVTLMPGEKRDVTLAIHAQDAQPNGEYDLVAHLVADEGGDPIVDYADVHVTVFVPVVEFEMAVLEYNPETLVHTVVVTNNSNFALTDLDVTYEVLSGTGEVFVNPAMEHVYLPEGASREFDVIPMPGQDFDGMQVELTALAAGAERSATLDVACLEGCNVLEGQAENVMMEARSASGYCTNNPTVRTYIDLPSGFRRENVANATLRFSARWRWHFWAREHPRPHNVHIYINGHHTGSLTDTIPIGIYTFEVDPAFLNETAVGVSRNEIVLITEHLNGGHYIMATDLALSICLDEYTEMVCAADQAQADGIVAGRSYLIPAAEEITTRILEPGDGAGVPFGSEILVSAWITDSLASDHYYTVIGYSDNNSGSLILHDDGRHGDGAAHDGVYANTWTPLRPGQTVLSVAAGNCDCTGSDSVILDVYTSDARLDLAHSVPVTGVSVLEETFSYPPLTSTVGGQDVTYDWSYELTPTNRSRTTYFQSTLPDMRPGEVRQVAAATVVSYTTPGGHGEVTLPPLYVKAANLTAIAPSLYTANPGGEAYYDVTLYNPQSTSDVFTLTLDGLPTDWIVDSHIVPVEAGATVVVPVAVPVPAGAELGDYAFAVTVETGSGGRDSATAQLEVIDLVQVDVEPSLLAADNGETVTYTLTITNLENADRTYTLAVEGLEGNAVDLLETLDVGAASAVTTTMRVTAWAPKGVYAFRVTASHQSSEQNAQASGEAALAVLSELGVEVALDPAEATGGRGSPAAYTVSITNIGSLADTYDLAVSVPDGWTADLSANGAQVSEITLTPYVFNEASLQLLVIPAEDASPDDYAFEFVATSQTDPGIQAAITGTILVSRRGVTVQIAPHSTTMDPTGTHTWDVTVRNTGEWQDTFDLEISGIVSGTAQFDVNPVTLSPGESTVVQMTAGPLPFALPQTYPFGVTARSQGNPEIIGYDVAEITFEGFEAVDVGILPATQTVTDTLSASFLVVITNTGNIDTVYALSASSDPALDLALEVDEIYIPPHMAAGILLTAQADDSGTYDIAVQADSVSSSASDMGSATLTIVITNKAPVATDDDVATDEDVAVTIDVLANDSDPDDDDLSIDSVTQGTHGSVVNNGTDVTYTPDTDYNGTDSFTYVVTDGVLTDTATVTVTVSPVNDAPVAMSDSATTGEDTAVTVDVLDNDDDADGDSLSIDSVTQPMSGTVVITFEDLVLYTPDPDACGGDSFTYVATDGTLTDTATVDVAVICVPDAPVAIDDSAATDEDAPVTIDVLDNDSDVDGDSLMVDSVTQPAHGTVTNNGTDVTYTPGVNYCGSDSFSYVVTDGTLPDSATVDVTVTCVPDTPVANDDTATTDEDAAVIVDVLANDGDVDGDSLGIDSVTQGSHGSVVVVALEELAMYTPDEDYCGGDSFSYVVTDGVLTDTAVVDVTVTCVNDAPVADNDSATTEEDTAGIIDVLANDSDADGDPLSVDSVTRPANGTVANNGTDLTYTPETDYCGGDSFAYVVTDGVLTDTATVDVTVVCVPDTPVANDDTATMDEDTTATIDVLANDEDADGDPLAVDSVTQGSHGSVVNNGIDVTYTPDIGYTGPDTFTYVVTDGVLTDTAVVSVTVTPIVITCELYPIALHIETLNGVQVGEEMEDIYNGGGPGNFGWLSWTGDPSVPTLVQSLTPPGDSDTYVNPYDPVDHILTTNDWVYGKPGVSNSKNVRDALDTLKAYTITVPVWQEATGEGNHLKYRVVGFAQIRITDYRLSGTDRISAIFLGYTTCGDGGPNVAPLVQVGPDQVADEGDPVTFEGSFTDPDVGDAHQFLWDFGDGTTEAGVPDAGRILTTTHVYTTSGVYAVTLTVLDNHGGVGIDSLQVTVDEGTPALACLHASESIDIRDRVVIAADVCGGGYLELGADARVEGDVVVDGDAFLRSRARVTGDMTLAGSLRKQTDVVIEGSLEEGATVALPDIPVKDVPYGSRNVTVKNGKHETWAPGDYKDGMVRARGSVVLTAGTYNFRKLQIEPDAELILDTTGGEIVVNVDGQLEFGDRSLISTQGDGTVTFYTNGTGTLRIGTDVTFRGAIVAPYAEVHVFSRTQVNCCIAARRIVIEPDTTLRPFRGGTPAVGWPTSVVATKGSRDLLAKVGMNVGYLSMMMVVGLFLGKNGAQRKKRG